MKDFLKKLYPFLSTAAGAVGGPLGAAAANTLGKALGIDKLDPSVDELAAAYVSATPEQRLAAEREEHEFALKMQAAGFTHIEKLEEFATSDRANARDREIKTGDKMTPRILSAIVVCAWVTVQTVLLFHIVDTSMRELVARVLGTLDAALMLVLGYYFGSSAGSAGKDSVIKELSK
jgi:hypothetical protein